MKFTVLNNIDINEYMNQIGKWFDENGFTILIGIALLLIGILLIRIIMVIN